MSPVSARAVWVTVGFHLCRVRWPGVCPSLPNDRSAFCSKGCAGNTRQVGVKPESCAGSCAVGRCPSWHLPVHVVGLQGPCVQRRSPCSCRWPWPPCCRQASCQWAAELFLHLPSGVRACHIRVWLCCMASQARRPQMPAPVSLSVFFSGLKV